MVVSIKEEVADLDLDSLHGLISTCDFTADLDIKTEVLSQVPPPAPGCLLSPGAMVSPAALQQHSTSSHPQLSPVASGYFPVARPLAAAAPPSLSPGHHFVGGGDRFDAYHPSAAASRRPSAIGFAPPRLSPQPVVVSPLKRPHSGRSDSDTNGYAAVSANGEAGLLVPVTPPRPVCLVLGEEEMLGLMKLEMSFENSNSSLPCMSPETAAIWNAVLASYNFELLKNGFHFDWISEAIEVSLRRNLIFMQVRGPEISLFCIFL